MPQASLAEKMEVWPTVIKPQQVWEFVCQSIRPFPAAIDVIIFIAVWDAQVGGFLPDA